MATVRRPPVASPRLSTRLLAPPPVDPAIPLEGFNWEASLGRFINGDGYEFNPRNGVFLNTMTRKEYTFDTSDRLFKPRTSDNDGSAAEPFTPVKELLSGVSTELTARKEALTSLIGQLTRRFTPRSGAATAPHDEDEVVTLGRDAVHMPSLGPSPAPAARPTPASSAPRRRWGDDGDEYENSAQPPVPPPPPPSSSSIQAAATGRTPMLAPANCMHTEARICSPRLAATTSTSGGSPSGSGGAGGSGGGGVPLSASSTHEPWRGVNSARLSSTRARASPGAPANSTTSTQSTGNGDGASSCAPPSTAALSAAPPPSAARVSLCSPGLRSPPPRPRPLETGGTSRHAHGHSASTSPGAGGSGTRSEVLSTARGPASVPLGTERAPSSISLQSPLSSPMPLGLSFGSGAQYGGFGSPGRASARDGAAADSEHRAARDTPLAEGARSELAATREALRQAQARHAKELEAVRRGWSARCDELTVTIGKLRRQIEGGGEGGRLDAPASAAGAADAEPVSADVKTVAAPVGAALALGAEEAEPTAAQSTGWTAMVASWEAKVSTLEAALTEARTAAADSAAQAKAYAEAADVRVAAAEAEGRKFAEEAREWRRQAERAIVEAKAARACPPSPSPLASSTPLSPSPSEKRAAAAEVAAAEAEAAAAEATKRADTLQAEGACVAERLHEQLGALALALEGMQVPDTAFSGVAESECRRAVASAEGRLQLEQQRYMQQIERLEFENEELRRATRAKSDKISALKQQLTERSNTERSNSNTAR